MLLAMSLAIMPFPECHRTPGHFGGCCSNCKWRDHAARCSVHDNDDSSDRDNDGAEAGRGDRVPQGQQIAPAPPLVGAVVVNLTRDNN